MDESIITDEAAEMNKISNQLIELVSYKSKFEITRVNDEYSGEFITVLAFVWYILQHHQLGVINVIILTFQISSQS